MTTRRSVDRAGTLQLAAMAALFAALWTIGYLVYFRSSIPVAAAILIGIAAACVGFVVQFLDWERLGGREAILATNGWIRDGAIPPSVPPEVWMPALTTRERRAQARWVFVVAAAVEGWLASSQLMQASSVGDRLLWATAIVFWIGTASWVVYYNLRWLPVIRRLIRQPRTAHEPVTPEGAPVTHH